MGCVLFLVHLDQTSVEFVETIGECGDHTTNPGAEFIEFLFDGLLCEDLDCDGCEGFGGRCAGLVGEDRQLTDHFTFAEVGEKLPFPVGLRCNFDVSGEHHQRIASWITFLKDDFPSLIALGLKVLP